MGPNIKPMSIEYKNKHYQPMMLTFSAYVDKYMSSTLTAI